MPTFVLKNRENDGIAWSAAYEGKGGEGVGTARKTYGCEHICPTLY